MAVDVSLFGLFLFIALRSQRFWPLWVAGFHLVTVAAHAIKAGEGDCFIAAGVEAVSRYGSGASDTAPNPSARSRLNPAFSGNA